MDFPDIRSARDRWSVRRWIAVVAAAGLLVGLSGACGGDDDGSAEPEPTASEPTASVQLPVGVDVTENLEVTSSRTMDVYEPTEGGPWPVVVMWHGQPPTLDAPNERRQRMAPLARAVAEQGALVFNVSYGAVSPQEIANDTACSLQLATEQAPGYGGDPDRLTSVGHSFGAAPAFVWGLDSPLRTEAFEDCMAEATSLEVLPDAAVGVAAGLDPYPIAALPANEPWRAAGDEYLAQIDAQQLVGGNPDLRAYFAPQEALAGQFAKPENSIDLHEALLEAGYESTLLDPQLSGPHGSAINPDSPDFQRLVEFVASSIAAEN